jgi:hypothetical protein
MQTKFRALAVVRVGVVAAACMTVMNLNATVLMHYLGDPIEGEHSVRTGLLEEAHHIEATAEFLNAGDSGPTAMSARVVDVHGNVLMAVQSVGEIGTSLWTGTFSWASEEITEWAWVISTTGVYPEDYISSVNGPQWAEDQAIVGHGMPEGNWPWDGYADVMHSPGTWAPAAVPDGGSSALLLGIALVAARAMRRDKLPCQDML